MCRWPGSVSILGSVARRFGSPSSPWSEWGQAWPGVARRGKAEVVLKPTRERYMDNCDNVALRASSEQKQVTTLCYQEPLQLEVPGSSLRNCGEEVSSTGVGVAKVTEIQFPTNIFDETNGYNFYSSQSNNDYHYCSSSYCHSICDGSHVHSLDVL